LIQIDRDAKLIDLAMTLRCELTLQQVRNPDLILYGNNSRRLPGGAFRFFFLCKGMTRSSQRDRTAFHINGDPIGIGLRTAY
jgi:hypothetical protein